MIFLIKYHILLLVFMLDYGNFIIQVFLNETHSDWTAMFGEFKDQETQRIGFLLIPNFSMIAFTAAIEPLRTANRLSGKKLYDWKFIGTGTDSIQASNGLKVFPDLCLYDELEIDTLIICAGIRVNTYLDPKLMGHLRTMARNQIMLGSVCTGSILLAQAGLLNQRRCTIHWENIEGFAETYPKLNITATLFEVDQKRFTCSGGTAPIDMMVHSIKLDYGEKLSLNVADRLLHNYVREPHDAQRMTTGYRTGIHNPKLLAAIGYMEVYIENPLPLNTLADSVNISLRQLERLFKAKLDTTPTRYYLELRLQRARQLLKQTSMSVLQVAVSTGFMTASHFTQSYKRFFGHPPSQERK